MHIQKVGHLFVCGFLAGLSCCYLEGTLAMRWFTVLPGAAGGIEYLWAAKFVGWFPGVVALVDTGRLINDIFISHARCGQLPGGCPFARGGGSGALRL